MVTKSPELIKEQEQLIETIKRPDRYYRISVWGYGSEMVWNRISKECADWWNSQEEISPEEYMSDPEEFVKEHTIPDEANFLRWENDDGEKYYSGWHEPPEEAGHFWGCNDEAAHITVEEIESKEYNAPVLETIMDSKTLSEAVDEHEVECSIKDEDAVLPKGWYAQMISSEKGTFFDGVLHLVGETFDPTKLVINQNTMPNDEVYIQSVSYGTEGNEVEIDNDGGDTNGKGYSVHFYEETYEPPVRNN
jgi:hypothetical protein